MKTKSNVEKYLNDPMKVGVYESRIILSTTSVFDAVNEVKKLHKGKRIREELEADLQHKARTFTECTRILDKVTKIVRWDSIGRSSVSSEVNPVLNWHRNLQRGSLLSKALHAKKSYTKDGFASF